jgi:LysM repeat protein
MFVSLTHSHLNGAHDRIAAWLKDEGAGMKKKHRIPVIIIVVLISAFGLSACERSASTPPPATQAGSFPVPEGTQAPMAALEQISTQTAIAASGGVAIEPAATTTVSGQGAVVAAEESAPTEEPKPTATTETQPEPQAEEQQDEQQEEQQNKVQEEYSIPDTYTLKNGEFPYCIARRFDIAPSALLSNNGLSSSSMTYPGTVLKIPKNASGFNQGARALRQHPTAYTVRAGDTVNSIACLFGDVDPRAIEDLNDLNGAYTLNVGSTIQIP